MSERRDSLFLRALRRKPVPRTPVWLMRQAGRYLPEYRAVRERAGDFLTLASTPEMACEVTLQPVARFGLDAAILFSDILVLPHEMGLGLHFAPGEGPRFERPLHAVADIDALPAVEPPGYVLAAVELIRRELDAGTPLIGFAGAPWTVATYMVEGGSSRDFARTKRLLLEQPDAADRLMATLARATADYLAAQARAGADALMVFDSWGGVLAPDLYARFSLAPQRFIVERLRETVPDVPVILFGKGCGQHLEALADTGCRALGVDWTVDLGAARTRVGDRVALQGNLDPVVMRTTPDIVRARARAVLDAYGPGPGHVFNLGHGITPDVPPEHVACLVEAVAEYSANQSASGKG